MILPIELQILLKPGEVWKSFPPDPSIIISNFNRPPYRLRYIGPHKAQGFMRNKKRVFVLNGVVWSYAHARLLVFRGQRPKGCVVRHIDDTDNEDILNLAWGTQKQNIQDAIRNGKNWTKEIRESLSERNRGNQYGLGRTLSEEHRRKISEKNKGRIITEKMREAVSRSNQERRFSEETLRKKSESMKAYHAREKKRSNGNNNES